jgi:hypothetical protein
LSVVSAVDWTVAVKGGPEKMNEALKKTESQFGASDKYNVASLHLALWQQDALGNLRGRDPEFVQSLSECVHTFLERSKDRSLSNVGKKALGFALEAGVLQSLAPAPRRDIKKLNTEVLKELEKALNARQAELGPVSRLTNGVDTLFPRWDRNDKKTSGKLDQRDAMPPSTWQWLEDLPKDPFARMEAAYKAFEELSAVVSWSSMATFLRDNDLLSDDALYARAAAYIVVYYGAIVQEHFVNFMDEHFSRRFHAAPVKKLPRIFTKLAEDEPRLTDEKVRRRMPKFVAPTSSSAMPFGVPCGPRVLPRWCRPSRSSRT